MVVFTDRSYISNTHRQGYMGALVYTRCQHTTRQVDYVLPLAQHLPKALRHHPRAEKLITIRLGWVEAATLL